VEEDQELKDLKYVGKSCLFTIIFWVGFFWLVGPLIGDAIEGKGEPWKIYLMIAFFVIYCLAGGFSKMFESGFGGMGLLKLSNWFARGESKPEKKKAKNS